MISKFSLDRYPKTLSALWWIFITLLWRDLRRLLSKLWKHGLQEKFSIISLYEVIFHHYLRSSYIVLQPFDNVLDLNRIYHLPKVVHLSSLWKTYSISSLHHSDKCALLNRFVKQRHINLVKARHYYYKFSFLLFFLQDNLNHIMITIWIFTV